MSYTDNLYGIEVKTKAKSLRKMVTFSIFGFVFLSFVYMLYWIGVMSDSTILDYTGKIFTPLAKIIFPFDNSLYIYRNTSIFLFCLTFPAMFAYYLIDKIESRLLKQYRDYLDNQERIKRIEEEKNRLKEFDIIKSYSICLSLSYENSNINDETKKKLNKAVFKRLKEIFNALNKNIKISLNEVMIIVSSNFEEYDKIYGTLLKMLSKIQKILNKKYNFKLIPSITTDAYENNDFVDLSKIQKQHYEIQSFKMQNRALTSALFRKKYQHLNHNKYAGIPIGEYMTMNRNSNNSYELNVVFKNLSKTLASL